MKKPIWKGNKITLIALIVVTVAIAALAVTGITYAVWTKTDEDNRSLTLNIDPYNPSEKYLVFRGLDESGNLTANDESAASYAVVGYTGLVAEVVIPATHNGKPVVKLCTSNLKDSSKDIDDFKYRFNGNPVITSLQIPESVETIAVSACAEMSLLEKVEILGEADLTIGDYAFANCPYLQTFTCDRKITGDREKYLLGSNQ